jgi:hypothetical protein
LLDFLAAFFVAFLATFFLAGAFLTTSTLTPTFLE